MCGSISCSRSCPLRVAWLMEAVGDVVGFAVCLVMMRYGLKMTLDSAMLGSITIKNLVFPEWWLLWPLPVVLCVAGHRIRLPLRPADPQRARPPHRSDLGGVRRMNWVEASIILFGGLVALMSLGLSVAFGFLAINIVAALMFLGGEQGLSQLARNAGAVGDELLADADPVLRADGRGAVSFRRGAQGDRRLLAA